MARGFGGETSEQEARGNENISESQVSSGRGDAISRSMGFGGNDGSNDEDVDQSFQQDLAAMANLGAVNRGYAMGNPNYNFGQNYNPITDSYSKSMAMNQFMNIANTPAANLAGARSTLGRLQGVLGSGNPISKDLYNGIMGITNTNPYGHQNAFSRILGIDPKNIDYVTGPGGIGYSNAAKIAQKKYNRYSDFANQSAQAQKQAFGSLFGNPVGELTAAGPVAQQVNLENIPLEDALAVQAATFALGPLGYGFMEMADPFSTYVPAGSKAYNEQFDPAINEDLPTSVMGQASSRTGLGLSSLGKSIGEYFTPDLPAQTKVGIESLTPASYETRADIAARTSKRGFAPPAANIQRTTSLSPSAGEQLAMGFKGLESGYSQQVYDELRDLIETGDPFVQPGNENMYGTDIPGVFDQDYNRNLGPVSGLPAGSFDVAGSGGRTYQSGYQGQGGIYSPGGKGQTYYGGQQDKPFFDKFGTTAQEALDKLYGYVTG